MVSRDCRCIALAKSLVVCLVLVIADSVMCQVLAADLAGQVIRVLDGDTLEVLHNQHPERIRHNGIDFPEKGQASGLPAASFLNSGTYFPYTPCIPHLV
jgi:endonuclease YncB( thermonuclease family)